MNIYLEEKEEKRSYFIKSNNFGSNLDLDYIKNLDSNTVYVLHFNTGLSINFESNEDGHIYFNLDKHKLPIYLIEGSIEITNFDNKSFEKQPIGVFSRNLNSNITKNTHISMIFRLAQYNKIFNIKNFVKRQVTIYNGKLDMGYAGIK